jgi:hypothetical protein
MLAQPSGERLASRTVPVEPRGRGHHGVCSHRAVKWHACCRRYGGRSAVRSVRRARGSTRGGIGQDGGERQSPRRQLVVVVVKDGSVRWSFNGDGAPVNSEGRLRLPHLCGVEEGVRARSIDWEEAWRQRSPWLGSWWQRSGQIRRGSSSSGGISWTRGIDGG